MKLNGYKVAQIHLPEAHDTDPHPRLLFQGWGIHAGECFIAWLPSGWTPIRLETRWEIMGAASWYIPGHPDICPVGLFCRINEEGDY